MLIKRKRVEENQQKNSEQRTKLYSPSPILRETTSNIDSVTSAIFLENLAIFTFHNENDTFDLGILFYLKWLLRYEQENFCR